METPGDDNNLYFVVADDSSEDQELIKKAIKDCGLNFIVTSVFNGAQLLDLLLKRGYYKTDSYRPPDVIILDLKMHLMDGFEALKKIKENGSLRNIPVYVLTVSGSETEKQRALSLGAERVFRKPLEPDNLKGFIEEICDCESKKREGLRGNAKGGS
jgi:two-component system response regulator